MGLTAKSAHVNYLDQVIKAGAKDHFDWISLHPYEVLDGIADHAGTEPIFMSIVPTVRKMLAAQNPAKKDVPIRFTELGCDAKSKGPERQAHVLVKAYTMSIAQGVACVEWFEGRDGDSGPMGLLDGKGVPRPAYKAYGQLIQHLGQHPRYLGWLMFNDRNYAFVFEGTKGNVLVTWTPGNTKDRVAFGQEVAIVNPLTGELSRAENCEFTTAPILVLDPPAKLVAQAQANKEKPLSWGGDYRNAKSVSVSMGERNEEKGLHTLSGQSVAQAVVAYGGSARAGDVPGGNMYIVDPGFLSYESTPIEITAVVRRNANNDNSGFKLVYESTNGFKTAGEAGHRAGQQGMAHRKVEDRRSAVRELLGIQLLPRFRRKRIQQIRHPKRHGDKAREKLNCARIRAFEPRRTRRPRRHDGSATRMGSTLKSCPH